MAYSTTADVQNELKGVTFSDTTTPSVTQVDQFCIETDQYIDSRIGTRYVTPVTGAMSATMLKTISIWITVARIKPIMHVKSGDPKADQGTPGSDYRKNAETMIEKICNGTLLLPDATGKSHGQGVRDFNSANSETATFQKDVEQW